jgi:hypothetical protein
MKNNNLDYHKKELHRISEEIKGIRKGLGLSKRTNEDMMLYRLLQNYKYWITRAKTGKNIHRAKYARKRIRAFFKLVVSKTFHQASIVAIKMKSEVK